MPNTLTDIKNKIARRVGVTEANYDTAINDYFEYSMVSLSQKTNEDGSLFYGEQIAPLTEDYRVDVPFSVGIASVDIDTDNFPDVAQIYDVYTEQTSSADFINFQKISIEEFNIIRVNPLKRPIYNPSKLSGNVTDNVGFWVHNGNRLLLMAGVSRDVDLWIKALHNPNFDNIGHSSDFISDYGYGLGFIMDVIDLAASLLRKQLTLE